MPDTSAVSVSPTWGVPVMAGRPVGSEFGLGATATVAALVRVSSLPASSVKSTRTWMVCPSSGGGEGVAGAGGPRDVRPAGDPLVAVGDAGQPVLVGDARYLRRQRLAHLGRTADGGRARGRAVGDASVRESIEFIL